MVPRLDVLPLLVDPVCAVDVEAQEVFQEVVTVETATSLA